MKIMFEHTELKPLIEQILREVLEQDRSTDQKLSRKMAYSESEAASLLSLTPHQLRDERYRGRIEAWRIVGNRIRYSPESLKTYLHSRRYEADV